MVISIIVPIYNTAQYLRRCLNSIISQTFKDLEIILVDDGSTDDSPRICDEYLKQDSRIKVIHKKNAGSVLARHDGAVISSGEYITFVDSDDFILPTRIGSFVQEINERPFADMYCCNLRYFPNEKKLFKNSVDNGVYEGVKISNLLNNFLSTDQFYNFGIAPNLVSKCIKRDFYLAHEKVPSAITLGDDLAVVFNLVINAKSLVLFDNSEYCYEYNPNSQSHKYDPFLSQKIHTLLEFLSLSNNKRISRIDEQINEYKCSLFKNIVLNEFVYSKKKYKESSSRLLKCLESFDYINSISRIKPRKFKDKLFFFLIRKKSLRFLYFVAIIMG